MIQLPLQPDPFLTKSVLDDQLGAEDDEERKTLLDPVVEIAELRERGAALPGVHVGLGRLGLVVGTVVGGGWVLLLGPAVGVAVSMGVGVARSGPPGRRPSGTAHGGLPPGHVDVHLSAVGEGGSGHPRRPAGARGRGSGEEFGLQIQRQTVSCVGVTLARVGLHHSLGRLQFRCSSGIAVATQTHRNESENRT